VRGRAVILLIALGMAIGGPQPAFACSCPMPTTNKEYAPRAAVVFTGVVTRVSANPFGFICRYSIDPVSVEFDVETVYKGDVGRTVVVHTVASGASCGYTFEPGKRYTVFPWALDGKLDTGLCRGNVEGTIVASEYGLQEGHPPRN
jgi:hypothetical protein